MARAAVATKAKKKPADFKRPKRKVGRRAPQAANVTSVGITSRRINLLEQSVLQDKGGAAQLTHRNLTLPELLQQLGHYNAHVRQRALQGLRELAGQEMASNLRANAGVLLERFLPALLDEEAVVRDAAVAAWRALLPVLRAGEKTLAPFAKLVAVYFCSGLTHLQVGVRQDALRAIGALLDEAPELLRVDAGREALARLLENFRDLLSAAQAQGIRMMNSYDLLASVDGSGSSAKSQNGRKNQKPSQKSKQQKKLKKPKAPSGALALRFAALKVLHKLLASVGSGVRAGSNAGAAIGLRSASVPTTKTLLLYPAPVLVASGVSASASSTASVAVGTTGSWQEKARALLPALLELWLECLEGETDALSDGHVEHMMYIVECATAVMAANTDRLLTVEEESKGDEFFQTSVRLCDELLAPESFPMLPSASASLAAATDGLGLLSRWHGMNAALSKLACVYLRLPSVLRCIKVGEAQQTESLEHRVRSYVISTLAKYQESAELRAVASMQNVLQPLLEVVTLILMPVQGHGESSKDVGQADNGAGDEQKLLLEAVTRFYVLCSPKSVSFRCCTAFVVDQLAVAMRGQQRQRLAWPLVMQWVVCFADLLGQLEPQHMELGRRSLLALISVLKQLPAEYTSGDQMDGVLTNLASFFDLAAAPDASMTEEDQQKMLARTRFDALGAADQLAFVALVYHLPRYPVALLRALTSCCKSARICNEAKSFLVDILFQRRDALDLAHLMSFLVSTALAPVDAGAVQQQRQLELVDHVCRTFLAMNLGNSLPRILAPTLVKAQAREVMTPVELHTLVLLYRACVCSATLPNEEQQKPRSEIPAEMERELVGLSVKILVAYAVTGPSSKEQKESKQHEQERRLVEICLSTLALGETNLFASFLDELLAPQEQSTVLIHRLRVLQTLVRTATLAEAFGRHQSHVAQLIQTVEKQHDAASEEVAQLVRQLRGDLELLAVGKLSTK
ncbi:hypothetical protein BBJ28_00018258 [Nothophytophthora sp. Chile5]|nr:hypothetical protein BBJ28_00018258 [Nothophytophthora sp. Chile5]